ncbi:hypothetical protein PHMEG_0004221 [Phytophthora megakarya]|uniref:Uncharacterized protein n=1 Tax=Phytophthora megakarya TaxID=4795 RepID=A0A225WU79_9STRA|nr:hypothetical protein PHMEG_0004221 [Phytophthora megakarya]
MCPVSKVALRNNIYPAIWESSHIETASTGYLWLNMKVSRSLPPTFTWMVQGHTVRSLNHTSDDFRVQYPRDGIQKVQRGMATQSINTRELHSAVLTVLHWGPSW